MPLVTRSFRASDVDAAAALLAARHRRDRVRLAMLPARFESPGDCADLLRSAMDYGHGVAAERDGRVAGFLFSLDMLLGPDRHNVRFQPPRSAMLFAHGHAVDVAEDAFAVYAALYAAQAERLVNRGILGHTVHLPAGDPALDAAWADLGFGRTGAFAARDLAPLTRPGAADVEVREATPEDIDTVLRLQDEEARYHSRAPVFHAYVAADTAAGMRRDAALLAADDSVALLGALDGRDVGLVTVSPPSGGPLSVPDGAVTIGEAAVLEEARGRGVGAALVDRALAWGRARDRDYAVLHFSIGNRLSRPFWLGLGFTPLLWHLHRHLDPRMTWARG